MKDRRYNFFESYHSALSRVSDERYGRVVRAMSDFYFKGQEPSFQDDADLVVWELIRPILQHGAEIAEVRATAGRAGGLAGKGVSRNVGNDFANKNQKQNICNQKQNNSGMGIGVGYMDYKETANAGKKDFLSTLPQRKEAFRKSLEPYLAEYGRDMCNDFYCYWTERDDHFRMKFEKESTWEVSKRLARWARNQYKKQSGDGR